MPATREDVIYGYRYILNREPESEAAIEANQRAENWQHLREVLLASAEFQAREADHIASETNHFSAGEAIGRYLDQIEIPVDVEATADQRRRMFDRIAACWRHFGETEPHWSVVTHPAFKPDSLEDHIDAFFDLGKREVEQILAFATRAGIDPHFKRALDFGCGVGRLTVALAPHAQTLVGADISEGHLREARQAVEARGLNGVSFSEIRAIEDIERLGQFDLIVSRLVLQHNPPPIMAEIYAQLMARLAPGGIAIVQMPTFILGQRFNVADYLDSDILPMEMNGLPQREIFRIISEQGCRTLEVREDIHLGALEGLSHVFAVTRP